MDRRLPGEDPFLCFRCACEVLLMCRYACEVLMICYDCLVSTLMFNIFLGMTLMPQLEWWTASTRAVQGQSWGHWMWCAVAAYDSCYAAHRAVDTPIGISVPVPSGCNALISMVIGESRGCESCPRRTRRYPRSRQLSAVQEASPCVWGAPVQWSWGTGCDRAALC